MLTLCVLGGVPSSIAGVMFAVEVFPSAWQAESLTLSGLALMAGSVLLVLTLPSAVFFAYLASGGKNRLGGWMLLAYPLLVLTCFLQQWHDLAQFIWLVLSPIFLAALLAAFGGPKPSRLLASTVLGCWLALFVLGEGPDLIQNRFERAVSGGDRQTAALLLRWGADPQPADEPFDPLSVAVENDDAAMAAMLMGHGAWPFEKGSSGESPMALAISLRHADITILMLEHLDMVPPASQSGIGIE